VTWATAHRKAHLDNFSSARWVTRTLIHADREDWTSTQAYVVMPDHVHWLFALKQRKSLHQVVASVKRFSARQIRAQLQFPEVLWQKGFHDHAVRHDEDLLRISRYICANPIRAGLCESLGGYPHWDAVWLTS
jgi:REP element-mobilizing transposase RayT